MTRASSRGLVAVLGLLVLLVISVGQASAETVLLNRGQGQFGLGWLFRQQDGTCRIATPRHVIEADGQLVPADMLDRFGRAHATFNPVPAQNPDIDLAFLEVRGTMAEDGCSSSRVSAVGVRTALERMETATLAIATPFDRQTLHIERRATSRDADGGLIVAIGPRPGSPALMQGMSGGAILVDNRPVAMLIEVDTSTGTGIALRFDVIADELNKLTVAPVRISSESNAAVLEELMITYGQIASSIGGVGMFLAGQRDIILSPQSRRVSLSAKLDQATAIDSVTFAATTEIGEDGYLIVEVADGSAGFVPAHTCKISLSGEPQRCSFSSRLIDRVRITAPTSARMIQIHSLIVNSSASEQAAVND